MKNYFTLLLKAIVTIFSLIFSSQSFSQDPTGSVHGKVKDKEYKDNIPNVRVFIPGTKYFVITNDSGDYAIKAVPQGHYKLVFSSFGYKNDTVKIYIQSGHDLELDFEMSFDMLEMEVVRIVVEQVTNTENAVVEEIKKQDQVVSGISVEQIRKSQDRDAGQALQRIPGLTLMEGRFIMIRGLSERYNSVMINGAISPSTSSERRSFSFDLIPVTLLDRMLVFKSGSSDIPGDFAGGVIKIFTSSTADSNLTRISLTGGYLTGTTFKTYYTSEGSKTDFLGFDNGYRSLPSDFPDHLNSPQADVQKASLSLPNNFAPQKKTAIPDIRFSADWIRKFTLKDKTGSAINSINYSNTYQTFRAKRARYLLYEEVSHTSPKLWEFEDDTYIKSVRLALLSNWMLRLNHNHSIEFKNLFNQMGQDETIIRQGIMPIQRAGDSLRNYSFGYSSRTIYSGQLRGVHRFNESRTEFQWVAGFSYFNSKSPDLRRFRTYKKQGTDDPYKLIIPPTATTFDAARFYSVLNEGTVMTSGSFTHKFFNPESTEKGVQLNAGYYVERKSREFHARWMSYKTFASNGQWADSIAGLPLDQIFTPDHINTSTGFFLAEGTNSSDKYSAQNFLTAGYAGLTIPVKNFNIATGTRMEYNILSLQSVSNLKDVDVRRPVLSVLPFINVAYNISGKSLLRGAYSKTVNRPEFREIAPFLFYNFEMVADNVGEPGLKTANIHNIDFRYELYPSKGETFSLGIFYKKFINPIETYIRTGADNPIFTYGNANEARNYGVEMEFRKSLTGLSENTFIKNFSLVFNGSLIESKVSLGSQAKAQDSVRALQGQSPYVINAGIYYIDDKKDIMLSILYNIFGRRIWIVGDDNNPTVYEMPRNSLDISFSKALRKNLDLRLGIQNLLNAPVRMIQDSDRDSRITVKDEYILTFNRGVYITGGIGLRF